LPTSKNLRFERLSVNEIGFGLQDLLLKKAKELNFNKIWLSVLNSNERAINFYKKNGFEKIGNHDFQIGKENFEFIAMKKKFKILDIYI
jgi:ribosomal protein S18 acetylase RimI-like enzyme